MIDLNQLESFSLLDRTLNIEQAVSQIANKRYGVIVDNQKPIALIPSEIIKQQSIDADASVESLCALVPPTIVIGRKRDLKDLVESPVLALLDFGIQGIVVTDDQGISGVLPLNIVDAYLASFNSDQTLASGSLGDPGLAGAFQTPAGLIACAQCGYQNTVADFDPEYPPECQNPNTKSHKLQVKI